MKKVLFIAAATLMFAACGSSKTQESVEAVPAEPVVTEAPAVDTTVAPAADSTATATPEQAQ